MAKSRSRGRGRAVPAAWDKAFADIEELLSEINGFLKAIDLMSACDRDGEALAFGAVMQAAQNRLEMVREIWNRRFPRSLP